MSETTTAPNSNGTAPAKPAWARGNATAGTRWGQPGSARGTRATERLRKTIEGLPDWEPLPPGEATVRRPGQDG
jgi:hypothetical protein